MSADNRCREIRELASEVALGIADGEDRARVLKHAAECADCRRELERLSTVADELLVLAPEEEPPPGFELRVLDSILPPAPKRRFPLRGLVLVAAVVATAAITAGAMFAGFRDDRRLADHYRATLAQAHGQYFGAVRFHDPAGKQGGVLFTYRGSPSWMVVTVAPPYRNSVRSAELISRDGRRVPLPSYRLSGGAWGGSVPIALRDLAAVHLVGRDGRSLLIATQANPSEAGGR
jgi:Putative zinc-finger